MMTKIDYLRDHGTDNDRNFHSIFHKAAILDMLYGTQKKHFKQFVTDWHLSPGLSGHITSYWLKFFHNIFNSFAVVESKPSITLFKRYEEKKKIMMEKYTAESEDLEKRISEQETAITSKVLPRTDVLKNILFGDVEEIPFRTIESYNRTHNPQKNLIFLK